MHEAARSVIPAARVYYVVVTQAPMAKPDGLGATRVDLTESATALANDRARQRVLNGAFNTLERARRDNEHDHLVKYQYSPVIWACVRDAKEFGAPDSFFDTAHTVSFSGW